ncbi:MAG: hypothetical protein ABS35_39745, partial [Kaistia sp. SCN 65-12]
MRFLNPFAPRDRAGRAEAAARIKGWTRAALSLDAAAEVLVQELACTRPGCAPRETVILVVPAGAAPFRVALHKEMAALTEAEIVAIWRARPPL